MYVESLITIYWFYFINFYKLMQGDLRVVEPRGFASNLQRKLKQAYKANITSKNVLGIEIYDEVC